MNALAALARPDILALAAYRPATWDPRLERLHANELPWRTPDDRSAAGLNRYPDPYHHELDARLAEFYGVPASSLSAMRGSDEAIDVLLRIFCRAGRDRIVVCPPTFGMYTAAAAVQGAEVVSVPLVRDRGYALDVAAVLAACDDETKLVFLCSPNNPTGTALDLAEVERLRVALAGRAMLVLDEAYLEFCQLPSLAAQAAGTPHLAVMRTFSKAQGLAGARLGSLIGHADLIELARKVLPPYAVSQLTTEAALRALEPSVQSATRERVGEITRERARLAGRLEALPIVRRVWPSHANFLLVELTEVERAFHATLGAGLLVRDVRSSAGLEALRVTVGTVEQNDRLIAAWSALSAEEQG